MLMPAFGFAVSVHGCHSEPAEESLWQDAALRSTWQHAPLALGKSSVRLAQQQAAQVPCATLFHLADLLSPASDRLAYFSPIFIIGESRRCLTFALLIKRELNL